MNTFLLVLFRNFNTGFTLWGNKHRDADSWKFSWYILALLGGEGIDYLD